ncbi:MAG: hypothetical protein P8Z80_14740 [Pseudolabrys sp.]
MCGGVVIDGRPVGATVSIGAASALAPAVNVDDLLTRADGALYGAKHGGRNRVSTVGAVKAAADAGAVAEPVEVGAPALAEVALFPLLRPGTAG